MANLKNVLYTFTFTLSYISAKLPPPPPRHHPSLRIWSLLEVITFEQYLDIANLLCSMCDIQVGTSLSIHRSKKSLRSSAHLSGIVWNDLCHSKAVAGVDFISERFLLSCYPDQSIKYPVFGCTLKTVQSNKTYCLHFVTCNTSLLSITASGGSSKHFCAYSQWPTPLGTTSPEISNLLKDTQISLYKSSLWV